MSPKPLFEPFLCHLRQHSKNHSTNHSTNHPCQYRCRPEWFDFGTFPYFYSEGSLKRTFLEFRLSAQEVVSRVVSCRQADLGTQRAIAITRLAEIGGEPEL